MSQQAIARNVVSILRSTAYIVDPATAAATMTVARQPVRECTPKVRVSGGTTGSGTVTVSGTVSGSADSEVLTFTANGVKLCTKRFTAVSGVTTTGLADEATPPTVSVEAVGSDGSPQKTTSSLVTGRPAHISFSGSGNAPRLDPGVAEEDEATITLAYESAYSPLVGDILQEDDTSDQWTVRTVRVLPSRYRPRWFRLRCTRFKT